MTTMLNPRLTINGNDHIVLQVLIRINQRVTRPELVKLCHLPRTTVYDALVRLRRLGMVKKEIEDRTIVGRPKSYYSPAF